MKVQKVEESSSSSDDELMDDHGKQTVDCQEDYIEFLDNFQQERYTFLFDEVLEFKKRKDLQIRPEDYKKMIQLNREALVNFLQVLLEGKLKPKLVNQDRESGEFSQMSNVSYTYGTFPVNERQSFVEKQVSDKEIEENFKTILQEKKNGELLNADIVAHLEYFHNTLNAEHKNHINHEDPFKNIQNYPALSYVAPEKEELASIEESQTEEHSDFEGLIDQIEAKMNPEILIDSPYKDDPDLNQFLQNMTPDQNKARKCSIRLELKNQSKNFVKRLSVFHRHQLLINPAKFQKQLMESVRNDKSSILSSSSDFSSAKKESLIDSRKYQSKLVKNSMIEIMGGKDRWNPNAMLQADTVYKYNGSPPPKRGSFMAAPSKKRGSVLINIQPTDLKNFGSKPTDLQNFGFKQNPTMAVIEQIGEMTLDSKKDQNFSARILKMQKQIPIIDQEMDEGYDSPLDFDV